MRTDRKIVAISLAVLLGACGTDPEQPGALSDDLKRDLAAASVTTQGDLVAASPSYQRMRFVSDIERPVTSAPARQPKVARHPVRPRVKNRPVAAPAPETPPEPSPVESPAAAVAEAQSPAPEPPIVIAQTSNEEPSPSYEPSRVPMGMPPGDDTGIGAAGGMGGGIGGAVLGGIIGAVVLRGGHPGRDTCVPHGDARRGDPRRRPQTVSRPDFGMPLPTGQTFPRSQPRSRLR